MAKFEIDLEQAAKEFYEIEGRYRALGQMTTLPAGLRKRVKDAGNYAHHLATLTEKEAKKHGY